MPHWLGRTAPCTRQQPQPSCCCSWPADQPRRRRQKRGTAPCVPHSSPALSPPYFCTAVQHQKPGCPRPTACCRSFAVQQLTGGGGGISLPTACTHKAAPEAAQAAAPAYSLGHRAWDRGWRSECQCQCCYCYSCHR